MSPKKTPPQNPKAADLLPPDGPAPVDPATVMASDASLEPEVEDRKIGIRRVSCLEFGNRIYARANRRPAGNSRAFWSKIEADDPFKKAPARPTDAPLEVYAAQRIERTDGSLPKPQPEVARAYPPPARARAEGDVEETPRPKVAAPKPHAPKPAAPPPKPRKEIPEPTHTPEPRPAPRPTPVRPPPEPEEDEPVRAAPPISEPPTLGGRPARLPPKPSNPKAASGRLPAGPGRQRMPSKAPVQEGPTAAEIREQKLKAREIGTGDPPPAKSHTLDAYRNFVQLMEIQQAAHERGEEVPTAFADVADDAPRPKPKTIVQRPKGDDPAADRSPPAPPKPKPAPAPVDRTPPKVTPPVDRTPPKITPPKPAAPVDRTPPRPGAPAAPAGPPASAGDLNDLFGGGNEGRVRIGKRAAKKEPGPEDPS